MAHGGGEYDSIVALVRERTDAAAAIVIVIAGDQGSGFSMAIDVARPEGAGALLALPAMLRHMADEIETDTKGGAA